MHFKPGSSGKQAVLICVLLAAATVLAYWPARLNQFVRYDDHEYITSNTHIQQGFTGATIKWAFTQSYAANWHPVTWLSHTLDYQLFGNDPAGHHVVSVLLHAVNALLVFLLFWQMTGAQWRSAAVAALFALHPLHVESVAWVSERKDLLSTLFGLAAFMAYVAHVRVRSGAGEPGTKRRPWTLWLGLSLACFALSLMSKPMLVTLPFVLLLLDFWPLGRIPTPFNRVAALRLLLEKLPFLLLSAVSVAVTMTVQQQATRALGHLSLADRVGNALVSYVRYLGKTFWPEPLAAPYPHPGHWPAALVFGASILLLGITVLVLLNWRKRPWLATGWFWFLGTLVPVIGLVQVGVASMADRYTYVPLIGVFLLVVWWVTDLLGKARRGLAVASAFATLVLLILGWRSSEQVRVWRDSDTFFAHGASVTRSNWVAHYNLATLALDRYQNLQRSSVQNQLVDFDVAPQARAQELERVVFHGRKSVEFLPGFPEARITLAKALTEQGHLAEALSHLAVAVRLEPTNAGIHQNIGEIYHRQDQIPQAVSAYKEALRLRPEWDSVMNNLAWILATHPSDRIRNGSESVALAQRACQLTGQTNLWYLHTLAAAYAEAGQYPEAVATAERARDLAQQTAHPDLVSKAEERVRLFRGGKPLRSP